MSKINLALIDLSRIRSVLILDNMGQDIDDIAEDLGIDHKTVLTHLKKAGYTQKNLDTWILHELTKINVMNRVLICDSLLKRNVTEPFLKRLITDDERWISYDNNV
ncbi:Histone-lysine N-methyltransferase SETMAR [Eumeta japonica]|uniref:Histone-lysine N-methyltransferase SETMAR n=1 Tax=Eumeta variegata TaxID=151549 RepID=A0A4C1SGY9_EUMVA|nr:Histone-lysine N-methyltransferase SETMAR [Eumeta japonica]